MKTKAKFIASLKIWVVIYPSITLFLYFFAEPSINSSIVSTDFLLTLSLVPWIVFACVPLVDTIIRLISRPHERK